MAPWEPSTGTYKYPGDDGFPRVILFVGAGASKSACDFKTAGEFTEDFLRELESYIPDPQGRELFKWAVQIVGRSDVDAILRELHRIQHVFSSIGKLPGGPFGRYPELEKLASSVVDLLR